MQVNRRDIKQKAAILIKGASPKAIYASLILLVLSFVIETLSWKMVGLNLSQADLAQYLKYIEEGNFEFAFRIIDSFRPSTLAHIIDFALQLVYWVVNAGFIIFILNVIRNANACIGNLLDGFGFFFKLILLNILESLFISLWTLLLIVPGFIAAYSYRMAIYLLIDNPDMSVLECIRESKKMMKNHKAELFVFDLSFFGWDLLQAIPYVGYIVQIWTLPYFTTSYALYYENLKAMPFEGEFSEVGSNTDSENQTPPWEG